MEVYPHRHNGKMAFVVKWQHEKWSFYQLRFKRHFLHSWFHFIVKRINKIKTWNIINIKCILKHKIQLLSKRNNWSGQPINILIWKNNVFHFFGCILIHGNNRNGFDHIVTFLKTHAKERRKLLFHSLGLFSSSLSSFFSMLSKCKSR